MLYSSWVHSVRKQKGEINLFLREILFLKIETDDIQQLLRLIDPTSFNNTHDPHFDEGLLQMKIDEPVKLQLCYVLQHLCDYQLQYRVEGIIAFSEEFVGRLQSVSN